MTAPGATTVVGIDLGTTYSCIARVDEHGKPEVIPNGTGEFITPSIVLFEGDARIVGIEAKNTALTLPDQVVAMVKGEMGKSDWRFPYNGEEYTPEEISSYILRKVAGDAEAYPGVGPVHDAVITCPAYFGIAEREATRQAGVLAGLNVLSIINEPTAAAIAYGMLDSSDQVVLVYDLGGGTFDVTMIEIKGGNLTVIATGGDHHLGGRQWDERVVHYLAEQWQAQTGSTSDPLEDPDTVASLFEQAERGKKALSERAETNLAIQHGGTGRVGVKLSREKFDELTADLLDRTVQYTRGMLAQAAEKGYARFDQIILVGGSTRMPQVKSRVESEFSVPTTIHEPDYAVAKGAALYAFKLAVEQDFVRRFGEMQASGAQTSAERVEEQVAAERGVSPGLIGTIRKIKVGNVTSRSFGVLAWERLADGTERQRVRNLIKVQAALPVEGQALFGTYDDNQEHADCQYFENLSSGDNEESENSEEIGNALLPLPSGLPAGAPIEITFRLNEQGLLEATARELTTFKEIATRIETRGAMSTEEMATANARSSRLVIS
jgi:molecular chaperone DnaK